MAAGTKLVLEFKDDNDKTVQFSYNHAKPSAGQANVLALMNSMISNTAIYEKKLVSVKSAKEVTTSENIYPIGDNAEVYLANPEINPSEDEIVSVKTIQP